MPQLLARKDLTRARRRRFWSAFILFCALFLSACSSSAHELAAPPDVVITPGFQARLAPIPPIPSYRCGAWAANTTPDAYSTLTIYAHLTHDGTGLAGINSQATAHFSSGDLTLDQQVSDPAGYTMFTLPLLGRQAAWEPATVTVSFAPQGHAIECTAFFTPQ